MSIHQHPSSHQNDRRFDTFRRAYGKDDHTQSTHGHTHGVVDPSLISTERGMWAIRWSFIGWGETSAVRRSSLRATHARTDGLTSLVVLLGVIGVWLGYPLADLLTTIYQPIPTDRKSGLFYLFDKPKEVRYTPLIDSALQAKPNVSVNLP